MILLKDFLSALSTCTVATIYDVDCSNERLAEFITSRGQAEKSCTDQYGSCIVASWCIKNNQIDVYIKIDT